MRLGLIFALTSYLFALTAQRLIISATAGDNLILITVALSLQILTFLRPNFYLALIPSVLMANYTHEALFVSELAVAYDLHFGAILFITTALLNHYKPTYIINKVKFDVSRAKLLLLTVPVIVIILLQIYYVANFSDSITALEVAYRFTPLLGLFACFALSNTLKIAGFLTTLILGFGTLLLTQLAVFSYLAELYFDSLFFMLITLLAIHFTATTYKEVNVG